MTRIGNLNGLTMWVVSTGSKSEVDGETVLHFSQEGSLVSARYAGGRIRLGYLIGAMSDGQLHFRYVQANVEGRIDGGSSVCEFGFLADGRLTMQEHFRWDSRDGSGENTFEEVMPRREKQARGKA